MQGRDDNFKLPDHRSIGPELTGRTGHVTPIPAFRMDYDRLCIPRQRQSALDGVVQPASRAIHHLAPTESNRLRFKDIRRAVLFVYAIDQKDFSCRSLLTQRNKRLIGG